MSFGLLQVRIHHMRLFSFHCVVCIAIILFLVSNENSLFNLLVSSVDCAETHYQQQGNLLFNHTIATLSESRCCLAATSSGELVFFAGGYNATKQASARVDILNVSSGIWTTTTLSQPRYYISATSSRNLVFFGGGLLNGTTASDRVDIYNISNGSWSIATLSQLRGVLAATLIGDLVLWWRLQWF
jgi:hypothetical protein